MKICIIGAGTAGLVAARHAKDYDFEPIIFEMSENIGGTWVYTDKTGIENGIDVHSSMYQNLRTNLPKEVMGYPDFEISGCEQSYVPFEKIRQFLEEYAVHFDLKKYIKFCNYVVRILKKKNVWQVIVKNLKSNGTFVEYFDKIIIGSGHYHTPMYPNISGLNLFRGQHLHSHDYRRPQIFEGKTVLVIGAGPSGMDLANIISKAAHRVYLSHHLEGIKNTRFFENVHQKPDVQRFIENGVIFTDGSFVQVECVLYCTGYKYAFPFLSLDCGIYVEDNFVQDLFKHCINIRDPSLAFVGIPFYVCAAQMMDLQCRFIMKHFSGRIKFNSPEEMLAVTEKEMHNRWHRGLKRRQAHMMGPEQEYYYEDLANIAQIQNIKLVMTKIHNESSKRFNDNLLHFRDDDFRIVDDNTFVIIN